VSWVSALACLSSSSVFSQHQMMWDSMTSCYSKETNQGTAKPASLAFLCEKELGNSYIVGNNHQGGSQKSPKTALVHGLDLWLFACLRPSLIQR